MRKQQIHVLCLALSVLCFNGLNAKSEDSSEFFWKTDNCRIVGKSADIELSTDGILSHQKIHFRIVSDVPLKQAPELQLNTAKFTGFELEGSGRGFGFEMVYTPMQVSYLMHKNAALVVEYEPIYTDMDGEFYAYHAMFPMNELPGLIAKISQHCKR
ncbi:MAG: hypothetical protein CMF61_04170 [Magnetococcales bacterium]|nr:hypothetical protein [Magnetococcales bacterium]PPR19406.1 MAG: hypothetical protein CFH43_00209 [Pseudomonadota bacterium]|tara:strand:- start:823 stop:1293 length:471 start_codon:yes stop_codon:yes gene_type:complete